MTVRQLLLPPQEMKPCIFSRPYGRMLAVAVGLVSFSFHQFLPPFPLFGYLPLRISLDITLPYPCVVSHAARILEASLLPSTLRYQQDIFASARNLQEDHHIMFEVSQCC